MTWESYLREILPYWLLVTKGYGLTPEDINWSCPADLEPYSRTYTLETKQKDEMMWFMGIYVQNAVSVAIERNFAGKKVKSKYLEKPIMQDIEDNTGLTQEEIDERELRKMLFAEQQWQVMHNMSNLPKTVIN